MGPKKVGLKPGATDETRRTNEIGIVIPLLESLPDIEGRTITADALLTQRKLATYLNRRGAHYLFSVKGNQKNLLADIRRLLDQEIERRPPDFSDEAPKPVHGRREKRSIWVSGRLNHYLDFPNVGQAFAVLRETTHVQSQRTSREVAYGVTSLDSATASPERLLTLNRGHWTVEAMHHVLDWSFDEDRSRVRAGHGPQNLSRLRRFAIGLIQGRGLPVAETMRHLARHPRRVLDFLKMTANTNPACPPAPD